MANERSLAVGVSFLGYGDPGDGVPASIYTQCPIIHEGSVAFNFNEATSVDFRAEGMKDPGNRLTRLATQIVLNLRSRRRQLRKCSRFVVVLLVGVSGMPRLIFPISANRSRYRQHRTKVSIRNIHLPFVKSVPV